MTRVSAAAHYGSSLVQHSVKTISKPELGLQVKLERLAVHHNSQSGVLAHACLRLIEQPNISQPTHTFPSCHRYLSQRLFSVVRALRTGQPYHSHVIGNEMCGASNVLSCAQLVASDHHEADACTQEELNGFRHQVLKTIFDARHSQKLKLTLDFCTKVKKKKRPTD